MRIKRDKTAWKKLRTACANLRGMIDAGLMPTFKSTLLKRQDFSLATTNGVSTST